MEAGSVTLVGSGAVIVSAADLDDGLRGMLTSAVSVEDCLGAIVAALSAHVRTLPSLVCAIREPEGIRLLLRGTAEALVTTEAGEQRIAPGSVSTWAEHMLPAVASLVLRHAGGGSPVILPGSIAPSASSPAAAEVPSLTSSTLSWLDVSAEPAAADPEPAPGPAPDPPPDPAAPAGVAAAADPEPAPVDDDPFGFRHLLDETMHVSTEEAAVRPLPEGAEEEAVVEASEPPTHPPAPEAAEPEPLSVPLPVMTGGGLIDSVPGASLRADAPGSAAPPAPSTPAPTAEPVGAGRVGPPAPSPAAAIPAGAPFASAAARPPVQAVLCDLGHPNPVIASACRTCLQPLSDRTPHTVPRPSLGRLIFTDGMVTELDSPVLIGRAPAESMAAPDLRETPKLLSLPSQDKRISRLHAEIRLEGWQVYVLDSSSLNGTTVVQPGLPPRQLRSGEPCLVEPGSSVNLGGAVSFTYEGPAS